MELNVLIRPSPPSRLELKLSPFLMETVNSMICNDILEIVLLYWGLPYFCSSHYCQKIAHKMHLTRYPYCYRKCFILWHIGEKGKWENVIFYKGVCHVCVKAKITVVVFFPFWTFPLAISFILFGNFLGCICI